MEAAFTTLRLTTWSGYKKFVDERSENWVFRGQGNAIWGLENAIERTDFVHLQKGVESDFVSEFQRGARNYLTRDEIPEHLIEWLALMQHHGAPTRLLDFSKSPFIAAYFAFELCSRREDNFVAVWAMNMNFLKVKALAALEELYPEELSQNGHRIDEDLFKKIFYQNSCSLIFPVEPFRMNRRYSLQQSMFVSTGNSYEPFMKQLLFLGEQMSKAVIKIEMPVQLHNEVLRDLQKMNLNRASLFPDLDGYALSLKLRYNSLKSPQQQLSEQLQRMDADARFIP